MNSSSCENRNVQVMPTSDLWCLPALFAPWRPFLRVSPPAFTRTNLPGKATLFPPGEFSGGLWWV